MHFKHGRPDSEPLTRRGIRTGVQHAVRLTREVRSGDGETSIVITLNSSMLHPSEMHDISSDYLLITPCPNRYRDTKEGSLIRPIRANIIQLIGDTDLFTRITNTQLSG